MAGESPASNSSESSPVQRQLNGSVDSGIAVLEVETPTLRRRQRLQQCQRILQVLQRDHSTHRLLRDRLSKIADRKWKKEEASEQQSCNVCCADLDQSSPKTYVTCCTCGKYVCRGPKCADWRPKDADWECQLCHSSKESLAHTSSWVAEQMSFNQHKFVYPMRARSEVYIPITGDGDGDANDSTMHIESISQIGQSVHLDERAKIRAYVEEIVAEMLGGSLDHIKVGQLSKSENYLQFFHKFHAKLSNLLINVESDLLKGDLPAIVNGSNSNSNNNNNGDSESLADISQTRLRSLIETIIAETLRNSALSVSGAVSEISLDTRSLAAELPNNGNGQKRRHRTEHYFEPKIYQDLLATAVLNKIADKEGNTRLISVSTPDLSGHLIDENYNAEALSTTSGSSIEPRSDCSLTDHELALDTGKSQSLQADLERESVLSDYIAAHMVPLPDFSASVTESEDDVGSISSSMIGDGTWEDNWLFKKKRSSVQSSVTPSSIGMLVPAPMENVRAQIGDRTADEVSDLSELGSDVEDNSLDLLRCNDLNDRLLSKHLIGGQNTKLVLDELVDRTSLISHTLPEEHEPAFTETTNTFVVASSAAPSDIIVSLPSPMVFQDDSLNEELVQTPIADQLSSESNHSDESPPSTSCETFNGDGDSEQEFVSQRVLVLDERTARTPSTNTYTPSNTNSNTNSNSNTHPTYTETTTNHTNPGRRTNGKLTNGSLRWSNKAGAGSGVGAGGGAGACAMALPNGGHLVAQQNDVDDDDVVLLRRFVPGSIAEREVKKWYNAVEMPNNPYAPDALKQRISGTQERYMDVPNISPSAEQKALAAALTEDGDPAPPSTDYQRYSRDYYINNAPNGTEVNGIVRRASSGAEKQPSAEDVEQDIVITEAAQNASTTAKEQDKEQESVAANVYTALPAQVFDDLLETQSNPSLHSLQTTTTTSDESETVRVYDFNKQETTVIRPAPAEQQPSSSTTSSMESAQSASVSSSSIDASVSKKRERPVVLQFGPADSVPTIGSPVNTPTRGSTPPAFRFLQPKRRLIEPSQVLSVDEDDVMEPNTPVAEKPAVEDEVVHAMPSVKALAQAFLLTSKAQQAERRWRSKVRLSLPADTSDKSPTSLARRHKLEHAVSMAEVADESTIASDLSSLETDPSIQSDGSTNPPIASPVTPVPVRHGFLRSNIAFFENLKFK
ncbi:serine-rich adhesin for platelets isoform X14 [Drosophila miranda]|uniref:serine-rich adhesin for platelets isoform X14 n=1 Tax=Drosophila miranda TaxID=7229 RepID=UPI0007E70AC7|nr:serine-rich adhesin for platelets isoform X14 [Drosophila miranda]